MFDVTLTISRKFFDLLNWLGRIFSYSFVCFVKKSEMGMKSMKCRVIVSRPLLKSILVVFFKLNRRTFIIFDIVIDQFMAFIHIRKKK